MTDLWPRWPLLELVATLTSGLLWIVGGITVAILWVWCMAAILNSRDRGWHWW